MQRIDPRLKSSGDVRRMFEAIAPRYDLLNRLLSAGIDARWRRRAVTAALEGHAEAGRVDVADLCCGTGDLGFQFGRDPRVRRVVGIDFAPSMLGRARAKAEKASVSRGGASMAFAVGDALRMPLRNHQFDVVAIAFGLRNLVDPPAGVLEMRRLLKPGGRLVVLDFFEPALEDRDGLSARAFRVYFRHVLPRLGRWLGGTSAVDAYRYLPDSVAAFARLEVVTDWLADSGFAEVRAERLLAGSVGLIHGRLRASPVNAPEPARAACLV